MVYDGKEVLDRISADTKGIIVCVQVHNMEYFTLNGGRLEITFSCNCKDYKTYVFCPDSYKFRTEALYKNAVVEAMKCILEVLWVFYPSKPIFKAEIFSEFCSIAIAKFKEAKKKDYNDAYIVYSPNGFSRALQLDNVPNTKRTTKEGLTCTTCTIRPLGTNLWEYPNKNARERELGITAYFLCDKTGSCNRTGNTISDYEKLNKLLDEGYRIYMIYYSTPQGGRFVDIDKNGQSERVCLDDPTKDETDGHIYRLSEDKKQLIP